MSNILLESDFLTVDLRSAFGNTDDAAQTKDNTKSNSTNSESETANSTNNVQEQPANTDGELMEVLMSSGITDPEVVQKLVAFGDPLKKVIKILGTKTALGAGGNPILAFIKRPLVQKHLIMPGLLNANTFKVLYNAVAKKLIADSEFFEETESYYNIIYCLDFYKKPLKEMEKYIELQRDILSPTATSYTEQVITVNKKVFLQIDSLKTLEADAQVDAIKNYKEALPKIFNAKLNDLTLAKKVKDKLMGSKAKADVSIDNKAQDAIVAKIVDGNNNISPAHAAATLLTLAVNTDSQLAKAVLTNTDFSGIDVGQIIKAAIELANNNVLPKGQIRTDDANALVDKIKSKLPATN